MKQWKASRQNSRLRHIIETYFSGIKRYISNWDIKRKFCRYKRSGNFKIFNSLYAWLIESCFFLNNIFLKALFWSFCILFWLVIFDWPQSWDPYNRWEQKREWYVIFRILRDALFLSLLRMPMVWFSLVATWFICFDHIVSDHLRGHPRYFTVSVCINLFLSRIILRLICPAQKN